MKTRRWLKVECSPSDTPPILLPRHLPPLLSFAANSLRSHTPLCDSLADTGLPADVRRCSEWICFPPPASCFSQTQKPLPSPSFEGRDNVWQGVPARSVLHWQKNRCFKGQKICGSSSALLLLTGDDVRWAQGVPARSVLHLQKDRCLEGAGKAALELDAACPSLTRFLFHVYSNASCGRQFQTSRRFFGPYKKQRGLRNSRSTPAGTASRPLNPESPGWNSPAPSTRISRLALPHVPSTQNLPTGTPPRPLNQNPPSETPSRPLNPESPGWNSLTPLQ